MDHRRSGPRVCVLQRKTTNDSVCVARRKSAFGDLGLVRNAGGLPEKRSGRIEDLYR